VLACRDSRRWLLAICLAIAQVSHAAEYIRQESPQPATAKDLEVAIDHAFTEQPLSDRFLVTYLKLYLAVNGIGNLG